MSSFLNSVDRGRLGLNTGLFNGLASMNQYTHGTQKARYYLLGGETGTGKTTLLDYAFLFSPYYQMKETGIKVNWEYYSFEQGKRTKEISWSSKLIYKHFGARYPVSYILSKGKNRISDEHYQYCIKVDGELEEIFSHVHMIDIPVTPTRFKIDIYRYGSKHGVWHTKPILDTKGNPQKNKVGKELVEIYAWTPNNPDEHHIWMMDHISYAALEFRTLKENIDAISRTIVFFREITQWTFVILQQFNTELASVERQKFKKNAIAPQRVDFGDSRYTFQDADVVFGMLNPYTYDLTEFHGYDIQKLEGYAIWAFLMKNRHDGPPSRVIPMLIDPVAGTFEELPEPISKEIVELSGFDPLQDFYDKAREFNESIKLYESI